MRVDLVRLCRRCALALTVATAWLLLRSPAHVYAHFPASAGSLTAIMHVEPDDYPAADTPQTIYFIFDDASSHFRLAKCACNLSISYQNQPLYSSLLSPSSVPNSIYDTQGIPFTFSRQGVYQIRLSGQPTAPGAFRPFNLEWNFEVGPPTKSSGDSGATILKYCLAILAIAVVLGVIVFLPF